MENKRDTENKRYKWVAYSHDKSYEDNSNRIFDSVDECYNDMRHRVLDKMTWNTEPVDFEDGTDAIEYRVWFEKHMIVHKSYSGTYVYLIVAEHCNPTYYDVFNRGLVKYLEDRQLIDFVGVATVKDWQNMKALADLQERLSKEN